MGSSIIIMSLFLAFSMTLSYVEGGKDRDELEDSLKETRVIKSQLEKKVGASQRKSEKDAEELHKLETKLKEELRTQRKLKRALIKSRKSIAKSLKPQLAREKAKLQASLEQKFKDQIEELEDKIAALQGDAPALSDKEVKEMTAKAFEQAREAEAKAKKAAETNIALEKQLKDVESALKRAKASTISTEGMTLAEVSALKKSILNKGAGLMALADLESKSAAVEEELIRERATRAALEDELTAIGEENVRKIENLNIEITSLREMQQTLTSELSSKDMRIKEAQVLALQNEEANRQIQKLIDKNIALETKAKEAGLAELQGKASEYVAQQLIERNAALEAQMQKTEIQLAQAQTSKQMAEKKSFELASKLKDAEVFISKATKAEGGMVDEALEVLKLTGTFKEAGIALAQADGARYMAEQLMAKNKELEESLSTHDRDLKSAKKILLAQIKDLRGAEISQEFLDDKILEEENLLHLVKEIEDERKESKAHLAEAKKEGKLLSVELDRLKEEHGIQIAALETSLDEASAREAALKEELSKGMEIDLDGMRRLIREEFSRELSDLGERLVIAEKGQAQAKEEMISSIEKITAEADTLRSENERLTLLVEELQRDLDTSRQEVAKLKDESAADKATIADLTSSITKLEEESKADKSTITDLTASLDSSRKEIAMLEEENNAKDSTIANLKSSLENEKATRARLEAKVRELNIKVASLAKSGDETDCCVKYRAEIEELRSSLGGSIDLYTIVKGDNLWRIAAREGVYKDPFMWPILYKYNLTTFRDPDTIHPGQMMIIHRSATPAEKKDAVKKAKTRGGDWKGKKGHERDWVEEWLHLN